MKEELELGQSMGNKWCFQPADQPILKKFRREVWLNSGKSQQMDGTQSGQTKLIVDKLEQGEEISAREACLGPGVGSISTYVIVNVLQSKSGDTI